jgi:hypothetical protein
MCNSEKVNSYSENTYMIQNLLFKQKSTVQRFLMIGVLAHVY